MGDQFTALRYTFIKLNTHIQQVVRFLYLLIKNPGTVLLTFQYFLTY